MSLPTPIDILKAIRAGVANFFFAIAVLLVVIPHVQWALMIVGIVIAFKHWIVGTVLFLVGAIGRIIAKNTRI